MKNDRNPQTVLTRRRLLARVGLAAGAAYMAPTMVGLNAAHASSASGASAASAPSRKANSAPSRNTNSAPSRSRNSGPSRAKSRKSKSNDMPKWLRRMMQG